LRILEGRLWGLVGKYLLIVRKIGQMVGRIMMVIGKVGLMIRSINGMMAVACMV